VATHGALQRRTDEQEREDAARRRDQAQPTVASDRADVLLALQQGAGNQAVSRLVQRKVKFGNSTKWATKATLPPVPARFVAEYQPHVVEQAERLAEQWVTDGEERAPFAAPEDFYRKIFGRLVHAGTAPDAPTNYPAWTVLKNAVDTEGNVTEVKWSNFNPVQAGLLLQELSACNVQRSDNENTTAFHGNAHGKLPKQVAGPNGELVSTLPKTDQQNHTPYVEFLIPGHKKENGIERGILDRTAGLVYITAHYDVGSFAWLSGVPGSLVSNWSKKASDYAREYRGK
jgi:hypothetical protein